MSRIAFHAPLKPPDDPTPSGDRTVARLLFRVLELAGHEPVLATRFRSRDGTGDPALQARLVAVAGAEVARIVDAPAGERPALWLTYHAYYKAPDLIGPAITRALGIPYLIVEPSHSVRRAEGPWAEFAARSDAALRAADRLLWMKPRDLPGLMRIAVPGQLVHLAPFIDPGPEPAPFRRDGPLRLLAVAMLRPGDKLASLAALADALRLLDAPFALTLAGDGPARPEAAALLAGLPVTFTGRIDDPTRLRALYESHDLLVWPGVGEGFGMVYLEAQAAGLPALAAAHPGPAAVLATQGLPPPGDAAAFARAILALAARPEARAEARAHVLARHTLAAAAGRLADIVAEVLA